jgi:hypothetical protein
MPSSATKVLMKVVFLTLVVHAQKKESDVFIHRHPELHPCVAQHPPGRIEVHPPPSPLILIAAPKINQIL